MTDFAPLPGDVGTLRSSAASFAQQDRLLRDAAATLRAMAHGDMVAESVDAVRVTAADVAVVLERASVRYSAAARALATYAERLDDAQHKAARAIGSRDATNVGAAGHDVADLQEQLRLLSHDPDAAPGRIEGVQQELAAATWRLDQEQANLREAERLYGEAVAEFDQAAREAAAAIDLGMEASRLNDTWQDDVRGAYEDLKAGIVEFGAFVATVLDQVSDFFAVLAVAALLIYPPAAAVLGAISLGLSVASMVVKLGTMLAQDKPFTEIMIAATFLGAGVLLSKLSKAGKITIKAAHLLAPSGLRASTRLATTKLAEFGVDEARGWVSDQVEGAVVDLDIAIGMTDEFVLPLSLLSPVPVPALLYSGYHGLDDAIESMGSHDIRLPGNGRVTVGGVR